MKNFFFITGLPRSKTAWLANFLTYGSTLCLHDAFTRCERVSDLRLLMENVPCGNVGHADPANLLFLPKLRSEFPESKWVVIHRDRDDSIESCVEAFGLNYQIAASVVRNMWALSDLPDALHVRFEDVESKALEIAQYVSPAFCCPQERIDMLTNFNIQLQRDYIAANLHKQMNNPILKEVA